MKSKGSATAKKSRWPALIVGTRPMRSKKGARWAIFTIQDMTGVQELLAFPESFARLENTLKPGQPLLLKVRVQVEEAGTRLSLQEARSWKGLAKRKRPSSVRVRMKWRAASEDAVDGWKICSRALPGRMPVIFDVLQPGWHGGRLQAQQRVHAGTGDAIREICGAEPIDLVM